MTARWIAAARALESESAAPLFIDPYARELAGDIGLTLLPATRQRVGAITAQPDPYLSLRTRFFDEALLSAVEGRGLTQVVLLGAGLDTRAFRLAWPAGLRLIEVDRADVFEYKESVLRRLCAVPACDRRIVAADLTHRWADGLASADFDPRRPAAFVAEGLVMYLHPEDVDRLIVAISDLAAHGSWLVLDVVNRELLDSPRWATFLQKLSDAGCGWHFGSSDPVGWLGRSGWRARVVLPGDPEARSDKWPISRASRSVVGVPRRMFVVATRGRTRRRARRE